MCQQGNLDFLMILHYFFLGTGAMYCGDRACMSVRSYMSKTTRRKFIKLYVHVSRQCNMLCTSGFVDDVHLTTIGQAKATPIGRILKVTSTQSD